MSRGADVSTVMSAAPTTHSARRVPDVPAPLVQGGSASSAAAVALVAMTAGRLESLLADAPVDLHLELTAAVAILHAAVKALS